MQFGGEGGSRTLETFSGLVAFEATALDHYATSPKINKLERMFEVTRPNICIILIHSMLMSYLYTIVDFVQARG